MAEILQVFTIARHLMAPESLPWSPLLLPTNVQRLRERYKFAELTNAASGSPIVTNQLVASGGEYQCGETIQPIQQLIVEPNVIQFQVGADSDKADVFYRNFIEFLGGLDSKVPLKEYTRTYQTISVVKLDVPFEAMFSEGMRHFLSNSVPPRLTLSDAEPEIRFGHLVWQVFYKTETTDYVYTPKLLTIEPRSGSKLSDHVYYVQTPTDFRMHMELLEQFERALGTHEPKVALQVKKRAR